VGAPSAAPHASCSIPIPAWTTYRRPTPPSAKKVDRQAMQHVKEKRMKTHTTIELEMFLFVFKMHLENYKNILLF
jgi:hypothetical protein